MTYLISHVWSPRPPKIEVISRDKRHPLDYIQFIDQNIDTINYNSTDNKMRVGLPVNPDTVPNQIRWHRKSNIVPDFQIMYQVFIVSDKIRLIIEDYEKDIHQFIPVNFVSFSNEIVARRYWFIVCVNADTVDFSKSSIVQSPKGYCFIGDPAKTVMDKRVSHGLHVWHDQRSHYRYLCSDQIGQRLQDCNFLWMAKPLSYFPDL